MSRITTQILAKAITGVQKMDLKEKEQLADEIYRTQPDMLASVIVLDRFGVSIEKIDFALHILFVCFTAMKISGLVWPLVTESDQERHLQRMIAQVNLSGDSRDVLFRSLVQQYVEDHTEQVLLSFVSAETKKWLGNTLPEDNDKFVILCIYNLVNCIAYVLP
ncbi:hypothetical protein RDV39_004784 [Salmonella enterica]|nr:hypothetical protein [Salmonella enterica]